ncbi:MAG: sulfate adenylyltransferase, partial [Planctomycetota bacterium]
MSTSTAVISPVHGGLSEPVNRMVDAADAAWANLTAIDVNDNDRTSLYRIADGTLSPLTGPMTQADYDSVLDNGAIERDGKKWAWTIPIMLPVSDEDAANCKVGDEVALSFEGTVFGKLTVESAFDWDKDRFIQKVYRTERKDHP